MRKVYLLLWILLFSKLGHAQFNDQFTDGGITNNPSWTGNLTSFQVNPAKELQLNASLSGGIAYLVTGSTLTRSVEWNMYTRLQFNPSDNDYVKFYLFSTSNDLTASNQGYFLKIGRNGASDGLEFYRQDGTNEVLLKNMLVAQLAAQPELSIKVIKNNLGKWVFYWKNAGAPTFTAIDSLTETTYTATNYFGLYCQYTGANATNFYFDDISAIQLPDVISDITPPVITAVNAVNATHVDVVFSEPVSNPTASTIANYLLSPSVVVISATPDVTNPNTVHLVLAAPLTSNTAYTLTVNNVQDTASNSITQHDFNFTSAYYAQAGDILINEIMAKPNPTHGLPDKQYIEIKNTTGFPISLANWEINGAQIVSGTIAPNTLAIICNQTDIAYFNGFGTVIPVNGLATITNNATLISDLAIIIDSLTFDNSWYRSTAKQNGGWSLELFNQGYETGCVRKSFWEAAANVNGGTPGTQNHAYSTQNIAAHVQQITATQIDVLFDGEVNATEVTSLTNYLLDNGINVTAVNLLQNNPTQVSLTTSPALTINLLYKLTIKDMSGCAGIFHPQETLDIAITRKPMSGELLLNEILHYPKSGGSDFVEIYNPTNNIFSIKDINIIKEDPISGFQLSTDLSASSQYILPYGYLVITQDKNAILHDYPNAVTDNIQIGNLPDFGIKEDIVVLKNTDNTVLDRLHYTDKWHFSLLKTYQGVSLERTNDLANNEEKTNWKSAAESAGFATPGYLNSTFTDISLDNNIHTKPEVFSPDQDGFDDEFVIEYNFEQAGNVATIAFYDINGTPVRTLINSQSLPKEGYFIWDGTTNNGEKAKVGIYLMVFEIKDMNGNTKRTKKKCVVATHF
ncbi:MAG TPA: lamin tail domain-containing protein [Chitinophagales bacterium]|nr:lamin tail domain-containing protein [Chitinophagales bacterium]